MSTDPQNVKSYYAKVLIPVIGILIILSWMFVIVPELKNNSFDYQGIQELHGKYSFSDSIGGELSNEGLLRDIMDYNIVDIDGDIFEIQSIYRSYEPDTNKIIYDNANTFFIDSKTRKQVGDDGAYFLFPTNLQKQNYTVIIPAMEVPATFVFKDTKNIHDLEVYVFLCESLGDDFSDGYPEFAPAIIYADQTCQVSVEPITGTITQFRIDWDFYSIQDDTRVHIEIGGAELAGFSEQILLNNAKKEKSIFYFYDYIIPSFFGIILIAGYFVDTYIRKSKEKSNAVKEYQKQIEMDAKLDKEKEEFVAMITHDLKQPLVPISGNAEMLQNPKMGELNEMQKDCVAEIAANASKQLSMIDNLVSAQKLGAGAMEYDIEELSTKNILKECIKTHTPAMTDKNLEYFDSSTIDVKVKGDNRRIQESFTNLILNAHDFVPEKGKIEIGVTDGEKEVTFFCKDNGEGIPKEKQKQLFKKYGQVKSEAKRKFGGTGLGLAVSQQLVEGMKGKIWLESEEGKGSTFFFTIPKIKQP